MNTLPPLGCYNVSTCDIINWRERKSSENRLLVAMMSAGLCRQLGFELGVRVRTLAVVTGAY